MYMGGICARFRTELIVVPGNLTGIRYRCEILDPVAVPFVLRHNLVFQQDNARPHTARLATTFLQHNVHVHTLPWPAFSPDMSPIEHLWDILDHRVSSRVPPPNTITQTQEALREEWEVIPQQDIRCLVHSMRRLVALIQAIGGHTRY